MIRFLIRMLVASVVAIGVTALLGACDAPVGPATATAGAPDVTSPQAPAPALLIGGSPLLTLIKKTDGNLVTRALEIEVDVNRGIVEAKAEDRFLVRTSVWFSKDGSPVAEIVACINRPTPLKEDGLRRGESVAVAVCINLPPPHWDAILAAAPTPGDLIDVEILLELLLLDGAGKSHVLDAATITGRADPQNAL